MSQHGELETVWADTERSVATLTRQRMRGLRRFLEQNENPHARLLTGRALQGDAAEAPDCTSARTLEAQIINLIRTQTLTNAEVVDWLRALYLLIRDLRAAGVNVAETRLPATLPSAPSPFSEANMVAAARISTWREALQNGIEAACCETASPLLLWGATILSSVLHGALLDSLKLNQLIEHLAQRGQFHGTTPRCYFEFDLPYAGLGNLHLQRWFPDALTTLLLIRLMRHYTAMPASAPPPAAPKALAAVRRFLDAQGLAREQQPAGVKDLIESASTWWRAHASSLDVDVMTRALPAHAIHRRSWQRIFPLSPSASAAQLRSSRRASFEYDDPASSDLVENVPIMHPWLEPALAALATDQHSVASDAIATLMAHYSNVPLAACYLGFIHFLLQGNSATGKPLVMSTIRQRVSEALRRLLFHIGQADPTRMPLEDLETLYAEISNECDIESARLALKTGLREFHTYLVRMHGLPHIQRLDLVLGDDAHLMPVDANLVTIDEYWAAQSCLDQELARGLAPDLVRIAKLVLMMAFRLGMRAMEIFGLRIEDVHLHGIGLTVLVREYPGHRLKTKNSQRMLYAHALLAPTERKLLRAWVRRRQDEEAAPLTPGGTRSELLLASVKTGRAGVSYEGISDRVFAALRRATGDLLLFIHHLRHAFATWTMLRLRAPDTPEIPEFFAAHPATARWLANGRRARLLLLGHLSAPSRVYGFAVARLLGHSSPTVSMGHYIHCGEIVMAAVADRELRSLPNTVLIAASGLPASTAARHLESSPQALVARTLAQLPAQPSTEPVEQAESITSVAPQRPRGRPKAPPPHLTSDWLTFEKVQAVLHLAAEPDLTQVQIAEQLQLAQGAVPSILAQAPKYASLLGLDLTETNIPKLRRPRLPAELAFLSDFEARLAVLARKSPQLCRSGLQVHLKHFNRQKQDVVFTGPHHTDALATYIQFLSQLGITASQSQCVLRTQDKQAGPPSWVPSSLEAQLPVRIRRIGPPSRAKASSYAKWLGIQLTAPNGNGLGYLAGVACMVGELALEATGSGTSTG
jgi:integrase